MPELPTEEEVLDYVNTLSNWGRWGPEDELGTLNFITDQTRMAALSVVRHGRAISLGWDIDPNPPGSDVAIPPQRYMIRTGQGLHEGDDPPRAVAAREFVGYIFHGRRITHLDALAHLHWDGRMYNDRPGYLVTSERGAQRNSVTVARDGIVTRGILLDAPRHRGVPVLERGEPVHRAEVEAILEEAGLEVREGDALFLRTGYGRSRIEEGPKWDGRQAGWGANCLPLFHEKRVAVVGSDTSGETHPSGYKGFRGPIQAIGTAVMGLWQVDNANLEAIARTCEELGTSEFAVVISALPFVGATGSAINPIALL
jgi:kynurenine formamidase